MEVALHPVIEAPVDVRFNSGLTTVFQGCSDFLKVEDLNADDIKALVSFYAHSFGAESAMYGGCVLTVDQMPLLFPQVSSSLAEMHHWRELLKLKKAKGSQSHVIGDGLARVLLEIGDDKATFSFLDDDHVIPDSFTPFTVPYIELCLAIRVADLRFADFASRVAKAADQLGIRDVCGLIDQPQ